MFGGYRAWRRRRVLQRKTIDAVLWAHVSSRFGFVNRLSKSDQIRLRELCLLFLHEKQINPAGDFALSSEMKLGIAIQACILILNIGLDSYSDWVEVIVYPDEFIPQQDYENEHGVIQTDHEAYSGQAWLRGPVILAWSSVEAECMHDGGNVVIHEFAHKLDMRNGVADGLPLLHANMDRAQWARVFSQAYDNFCQCVDRGEPTPFDAYACESPAEFFAVVSESFFEDPEVLALHYPEIYNQLARFYRQNPAAMMVNR